MHAGRRFASEPIIISVPVSEPKEPEFVTVTIDVSEPEEPKYGEVTIGDVTYLIPEHNWLRQVRSTR